MSKKLKQVINQGWKNIILQSTQIKGYNNGQ